MIGEISDLIFLDSAQVHSAQVYSAEVFMDSAKVFPHSAKVIQPNLIRSKPTRHRVTRPKSIRPCILGQSDKQLSRTRRFRMTILNRPKITRPWILGQSDPGKDIRIRPSPFGHDHSANRLRYRVGSFGFGPGHSAKVHSAMITLIRPSPFGQVGLGPK